MNRLAIISSFLGTIRNRFMEYRGDRTLEEKIRLAAQVPGLDGLELCYPADFDRPEHTLRLMEESGLGISAINFRSRRTGKWMRGSFSSENPAERREAVDDLKRAMDLSLETGCSLVSTCPLNEGSDYLFETDYRNAYRYFEESIAEAAEYRPQVRICLEYKLSDPRGRTLFGTAGETIAFCEQVGLPNIGVNLDIGHSLYAGERPAQTAVLTHRSGRLFYIHLNDNDKQWDWDMLPGTFNFWDFLEFFYFVDKIGYDGWYAFDIFPKEIDTVETFTAAVEFTRTLAAYADRIDPERMRQLHAERNPVASMQYLFSLLGAPSPGRVS